MFFSERSERVSLPNEVYDKRSEFYNSIRSKFKAEKMKEIRCKYLKEQRDD